MTEASGVDSRFWHLRTGAEIDYVEEGNGRLRGWEMKLSAKDRSKMPASRAEAYPGASWERVDRSNYLDSIAGEVGGRS